MMATTHTHTHTHTHTEQRERERERDQRGGRDMGFAERMLGERENSGHPSRNLML